MLPCVNLARLMDTYIRGHSSERTKFHAKGWARPGTSAGGLLFPSRHSGLRCGHSSLKEDQGGHHAECEDGKDHPETQPPIGDRVEQETHQRYAATFTHPASTFWRRISTPRQEHQVGRFLGIPEKRLARRAYLRTHGKATSKIRDLDRAHGHRKVGRDFSSGDPVPETTFHQRGATSGRVLQELPDLSVVHKRRDAHKKTSPSGSFLGRSFDGVPQEGGERVAKSPAARGVPSRRERLSSLHTP